MMVVAVKNNNQTNRKMTLMNTLTPSVNGPSDPQVAKLGDRINAAARKAGIDTALFQVALAYPGTELEDEMIALLVRFAKKASGIVTPVRAQNSGLVPSGWQVTKDDPEGDINLANLDYSSGPVQAGETYISGDTMLARKGNAYGSLGFAAAKLKQQEEGKEIFPVESRGKHYFIMPRTVLLDGGRGRRVAYFYWDGRRWVLYFRYLHRNFRCSDRFVRSSELPSVA